MFCVQCEHTIRTLKAVGCSYARGMCGKTGEVSDLQDMLVHLLQAVSTYAVAARKVGVIDAEIDAYAPQAFFSTLTNVNFDAERIIDFSRRADACRNSLRAARIVCCHCKSISNHHGFQCCCFIGYLSWSMCHIKPNCFINSTMMISSPYFICIT